ncbi:NAD(P)/FAD-dependent oxidoreductase [Calderihabitans maritimus]|uniref:FAD dependent oxidoreductase n=1 Tax=Calderihabitans maritimus TaxID=1246530 RepID=A0A1Z5HSP5_9FIRM|nr:FAD-dependent oxidoreductase [Calderihabitans maritimus]GAW92553.1 FAD dependent oxidoreductase [Calderihabitans maritimus]
MKLRVANLRLELEQDISMLVPLIAERLDIVPSRIKQWKIVRESVDARRKKVYLVYTVEVEIDEGRERIERWKGRHDVFIITGDKRKPIQRGTEKLLYPPVIVGAGPAGIFAALTLARWGYRPVLLERGKDVESRVRDVNSFWNAGQLDPESNVQFGEGGAGTFSDGKLTTRIKDGRVRDVLAQLVEAGAPEEITYVQKPHIGTDRLRKVIIELRKKLLSLGGRVIFQAKVTGFRADNGQLTAIEVNHKYTLPVQLVLLAIGHSARDTYEEIYRLGARIEPKPFAIGLRVEHPQELIDRMQYGSFAGHPRLGHADYHLTYRSQRFGRAAYTFCMCPGGYVIAGASEPDMVVTNGMSEFARDSGVANSALVATVSPLDFPGDHPLAGVQFQRHWERKTFILGGGNYRAPAQLVGDFLADREATLDGALVKPTYRPGVVPANLRRCLPETVGATLAEAIRYFDTKIRGFGHPGAVLTGVETRTSSPVRIVRDDSMMSVNVGGLYPVGEGAGYAGGIVSAAVDGMKAAESIIGRYALPRSDFPSEILTRLERSEQ